MKSVFVNTICRGIGPAFDAIDTAASRLMLSDIDAAERNTCCDSIRVNADLLLSALDNMLEAANLDSLTEALRLEETNIDEVCRAELLAASRLSCNPGVAFTIEAPENPATVRTHAKYFSFVVRALLDNARKFTREGSVTLRYEIDPRRNEPSGYGDRHGLRHPARKTQRHLRPALRRLEGDAGAEPRFMPPDRPAPLGQHIPRRGIYRRCTFHLHNPRQAMSTRRPILFPAICLALAVFCAATAQPLQPEGDNEFGGTPGMHLFLQSRFIRTHQADRLHFARMRHYREGYLDAVGHGEYARALAFSDSLIRTAEHHPVARRALHGLLQGTGGHVPQAAPRLRGLHGLCPCREGTGFAAAARTEQSHPREAGVVRTRPDGARRGAAYGPPPQNCPGLRFAGTAGDRCGRRCDLCRQPPYPATAEGVTPANEARPRKRTQKAAFVNSVCHEVRTPLNCIMGFSELLCAEEITPESRAQYCEIIRDNRRQLRFLFDDMLEVAYLENLHAPLPCQYTNLCAVCQAQLRIMKVRYPKPGIVYKGAIPVAEIALNTSDKYLTILISALLGNAYKFTQEGTISLECDRLGDDRVFVAVADTAAASRPRSTAMSSSVSPNSTPSARATASGSTSAA